MLKEQACLFYDGNRFQWNQQFDQLRNFVTNTVRMEGKWRSPGGRAKRFDGRNCDFSMIWYPGKCNSLLFFGTDGKSFKELLVSILNLDSPKQLKADNDESFATAARDMVETVSGVGLHDEMSETSNGNGVDSKPSFPSCACSCKEHITDLKNVKSDVAILRKQIESINRVIHSTNSIIESMSVILNPAGAGNRSISYDLRIETLLSEFAQILKEKNRQLEERDNIIEELQYKLCKIEDQYQNMPNELTYDEYLKQKPSLDKRNYKAVVCDVSVGIVPNNKTVDKLSTDNQQTTGINLHIGDNKVTGHNKLPQKAKSDCKELNCKKSVSLSSLEKTKISSAHRNLIAKRAEI